MPKKKQITIETIEYIQRSINDLLQSNISQGDKKMLCKMMEKILKDTKQKDDDYQYLHWNKYGKLDWEEDKEEYLQNLSVGDTIKIPQQYITGPDDNGSDSFVSDVQGEWSRTYY